MTVPFISFEEADPLLDWIALTDALAAGHDFPRAQIDDSFFHRRDDTILTRAAWIDGLGAAVKTATVFPGNASQGLPRIGGAVTLFDDQTGALAAVLDFALVTKWKTAADSLLAARRLAPPESAVILIVGAGTVGQSLREAYGAAFPEARFLIWNRSPQGADKFAGSYERTEVAPDLAAAVREADIVASATMSREPILKGDWLRPGQHIDLIGAYRPDMREADDTVMRRARIFVDSLETTFGHIGELKIPAERGVISKDDIVAEYYDLAAFTREPEDITLFKNGGGAHLDLMTCRYILETWAAR
jgi:ornithine cyclodeaminase